jgi:hypothetical protein
VAPRYFRASGGKKEALWPGAGYDRG